MKNQTAPHAQHGEQIFDLILEEQRDKFMELNLLLLKIL
jgi:hypothetical protein